METKQKYEIDGIPCTNTDYEAMNVFSRRCFECGEEYDWKKWEELPVYACGQLITEKTSSDVKKCTCGSFAKWVAPAYRKCA